MKKRKSVWDIIDKYSYERDDFFLQIVFSDLKSEHYKREYKQEEKRIERELQAQLEMEQREHRKRQEMLRQLEEFQEDFDMNDEELETMFNEIFLKK